MRLPRGAALDPRFTEVAWAAHRVAAADPSVIETGMDVADALRAFTDVLEQTWDAGRTATLSRIETICGADRPTRLELSIAVGVLGADGDTVADAEECASIVEAAFRRWPAPYELERIEPERLFSDWPAHTVAIRQPWIAVGDGDAVASVPLRFDREVESWQELMDLLLSQRRRLVLQTMLSATTLATEQALRLEEAAAAASSIVRTAEEGREPLLLQRAARVSETVADLAESYGGQLWSGEVLLASDERIRTPLARAVGAAISNQTDVIHRRGAASPLVAARARLVGGFEIEQLPTAETDHVASGLARATLDGPTLADCFSITEAALFFRLPVPAGRPIPTIEPHRQRHLTASGELPTSGFRLGVDADHQPVHLGEAWPEGHTWLLGATGTGKTTVIHNIARHCLDTRLPFVVLDPHGDLSRAIRSLADALGRGVVIVDADDSATAAIDLLGGISLEHPAPGDVERSIGRLIDALISHLPRDWAGPRFRQLARAAMEVAIAAAAGGEPIGLGDVARMFADNVFLEQMLAAVPRLHGARVLRQYLGEQDRAGTGLWVASKFEDIAFSPGGSRILAPFGAGVSVGELIDAHVPLIVNLSSGRLSRLASGLLGHVLLASTVDYALSRPPESRAPFLVFADEAHRLPAVNLIDALSEGRKYGLRLFLANQQISQLDSELRDALLANAHTRLITRVGLADAQLLSLAASIPSDVLAGLPNHNAVVQLAGGAPFSVRLDPPRLEVPAGTRTRTSAAPRSSRPASCVQLRLDVG